MSTATEDSSSYATTMIVYIPRPRIFLRLLDSLEPFPNGTPCAPVRLVNSQVVAIQAPEGEHMYTFRRIFRPDEEETEIFEEVGKPVVQQLIAGQNPLILMQDNVDRFGERNTLLANCLEELFQLLSSSCAPYSLIQWNGQNGFEFSKANNNEKDCYRKDDWPQLDHSSDGVFQCFSVFVSYLVIYNNCIYDLLATEDVEFKPLLLKEFSQKSETFFYPSNCKHFEIRSANEGLKVLLQGEQSLRHRIVKLNAEEQRCHTAYTISLVRTGLVQQEPDGDFQLDQPESIHWSQLTFVNLAGIKLGRLRPDNSLLVLTECLKQLRQGEKFSSHRKSKLTQFLARQLKQPNRVNIFFLSHTNNLWRQNLQLLEVAEHKDAKVNIPQVEVNIEDFDSTKLRLLLHHRSQQQHTVKEAAQRLRLLCMSIDKSMCLLRTDNTALLSDNHLQKKQFKNAEAKLKGHVEFSNQLLAQLNQARKDIKELRSELCSREKLCAVQEQTIALAKERIKRLRCSHEHREQHLVSMQSSKVTQLRVQLQLKEEELKKLRRQRNLNECSDLEEGICEKELYETKSTDNYATRTKALVAKTIAGSFRKGAVKNGSKD